LESRADEGRLARSRSMRVRARAALWPSAMAVVATTSRAWMAE